MSQDVSRMTKAWSVLEPILSIETEDDYWQSVEQLNVLLDLVGNDEKHPLYGLMDVLGTLVEAFESQIVTVPELEGVELLDHLMEEFELEASDLAEVASVKEIEDILSGEKALSIEQIKALSERFHVSPAAFLR